jgi:hypothetical protein
VKRTPPDRKAQARRAALNALKRAQRAADKAGVELSGWEGEFLGSVAERVRAYGRAFADPEKGAPGAALSARQGVKLKEIVAKAKGKVAGRGPHRRVALGNSGRSSAISSGSFRCSPTPASCAARR